MSNSSDKEVARRELAGAVMKAYMAPTFVFDPGMGKPLMEFKPGRDEFNAQVDEWVRTGVIRPEWTSAGKRG